jgi:hypothetical protein
MYQIQQAFGNLLLEAKITTMWTAQKTGQGADPEYGLLDESSVDIVHKLSNDIGKHQDVQLPDSSVRSPFQGKPLRWASMGQPHGFVSCLKI